MSSGDLAIETSGLTKTFGQNTALDHLDLRVPAGSVYGFLGPNGAGKTTTIRILATLLRPDGGSAQVLGHDVVRHPDAVRSRVSLTGQFASVDTDLSVLENLILLGRLLGYSRPHARARADELLEAFDLTDAGNRQVKTLSGGLARRLDIAASVVVRPDLLFLDEPTTGLDPRSRNEVWDLVRELALQGTTILLTTQYLGEADELADRIAVIDRGRVIAEGTAEELKASVGLSVLRVRLGDPQQRAEAMRALTDVLDTTVNAGSESAALLAHVPDRDRVPHALAALSRAGISMTGFTLAHPSLDEVFLALTQRTPDTGREDAA